MFSRHLYRSAKLFSSPLYFQRFASKQRAEFEIKSVPGNKPPLYEDSVQGKYAGVLFSVASEGEALFRVLNDMKYFKDLYAQSEEFRNFLGNTAYKRSDQSQVIGAIGKDQFHNLTSNFLDTLIENRRLSFLPKIADKYIDYYRILNKEENITIVSASELSEGEKAKIKDALVQGRGSKNFTVKYSIDPSILGGLQMYSGLEFLDCSLLSRYNRLKSELQKISF